jgi:hypothetical protein
VSIPAIAPLGFCVDGAKDIYLLAIIGIPASTPVDCTNSKPPTVIIPAPIDFTIGDFTNLGKSKPTAIGAAAAAYFL